MTSIEKSIEVNAPISKVYNQWTQFEEFPRFMDGILDVTQLDDKRLRWEAEISGKKKQWLAEITEQTPDRVIAWRSTDGAYNAGMVSFHEVDPMTTKIVLKLEYDAEGFLENVGDALGFVTLKVKGDLKRFKEFIEERPSETGAWRGEIHHNEVSR